MGELPIREVAQRTGLAAPTIRMWEQRYGFPAPARSAGGYRLYDDGDVEILRRVVELRRGGLSVPAALQRARRQRQPAMEQPTIFGALPHEGRTRRLRKRSLVALSRAIEDQTLASAARPVVLSAFQRERHYRAVEHRYLRMAEAADVTAVFADFAAPEPPAPGAPLQVAIAPAGPLGHEWAVVVDAPGFAVCMCGWELPAAEPPADGERVFETFWTLDPQTVRQASLAGAACARPSAPDVADRIEAALEGRPEGAGGATAALEALAARMIGYLDSA